MSEEQKFEIKQQAAKEKKKLIDINKYLKRLLRENEVQIKQQEQIINAK